MKRGREVGTQTRSHVNAPSSPQVRYWFSSWPNKYLAGDYSGGTDDSVGTEVVKKNSQLRVLHP